VVVVVEVVVIPEVTYPKVSTAAVEYSIPYEDGRYTVVEVSPVKTDMLVIIAFEVADLLSEI